ncbi:transmembrane protein 213 [Kogia breviceps]|uniref:transmembrane protein 213 n=1 Tax=Kogia breviceps TaxID=27615 RepID=UPI0027960D68|nr:transmembrane protein 213 [Kogia breviceps]
MAGGPQLASAGTVITGASLLGMEHLNSAPWAALVLSLAFASFHPACLAEASSSSNSTLTVHHPGLETPEQCPNVDFCPQAARCCHTGVDEYGWIAAAVGWSLLFLTLILLCVDKLMKLTPDEPKDLQA